jgi:hypothetical protein
LIGCGRGVEVLAMVYGVDGGFGGIVDTIVGSVGVPKRRSRADQQQGGQVKVKGGDLRYDLPGAM